jgi:3-oxoacyl-[acyl-carrier-protein] synthase II
MKNRVGVFGWGIVAPKSPNVDTFRRNLAGSENWLSPFEGFGPSNFLVGQPEFDFNDYREWIDSRFAPRHFQNLREKMDAPSLYAIGAFIQALQQNPGVELLLRNLGGHAHVYIGTGLGAIDTLYKSSVTLHQSQARWDAFWARPENNSALRAFQERDQQGQNDLNTSGSWAVDLRDEPRGPEADEWNSFWTAQSPELAEYLAEAAEIDSLAFEGEIEKAKLNVLRERSRRHARLQEKWNSPEPPWKVSSNLIWNIHNTPASQVSILGKVTGLVFAPVAACSTFGVALQLAMRAIQNGDAKVVIVGATDPPPHPLTVGSFYGAHLLAANRKVSKPLSQLQGTHVAGGSVVWIVADMEYMVKQGFQPIGMEPLAVGVSADASHIITPSFDGPKAAIRQALEDGSAVVDEIATWDLHATATAGDYAEIITMRSMLPDGVLVSARKGTFGHGMSAGSGWELTAQYMGCESGRLFPTPLTPSELNNEIRELHRHFIFTEACSVPQGLAGKLSMGIGGINACVLSRVLQR